MLTARTGSSQAVRGFEAGADDYLAKPFDLAELTARIQALLRRDTVAPENLGAHGISVDLASCQVTKDGEPLTLAPREYDLLVHLLRHKGTVQDRTTLIEQVWGDDPDLMFSQTVDVHVAYLRRKCGKELIVTVPGKGYLIND
jgi:DNA-binding response OmpR family regulator